MANTWATTIISALVLVVAFMQWRTAHQKVLLDLFEKRLAVYEKVSSALDAMVSRRKTFADAEMLLREAYDASVFLFGIDIQQFIDRLWTINMILAELTHRKKNGLEEEGDDATHTDIANEASNFHILAPRLFAPYMRMDQKRVRSPAEWLADRNRIRLGYADEKQR